MSSPSAVLALPGDPLGSSSQHTPGPGTHHHNAQICASIAGLVVPSTNSSAHDPTPLTVSAGASTPALPSVDSVVLARVTRLSPRQATVAIVAVGDAPCAEGFQGVIRVQDVRATEKDKVRVVESFGVGDIVRAVVISLGDQANYYLSTANNMLGVVVAASEDGNAMYPVNWREFRDPRTGRVEARKVAKPV